MNPAKHPGILLVGGYFLALGLTNFWHLPVFFTRIEPPELVFLALAGYTAFSWMKGRWKFPDLQKMDYAILIYLGSVIFSACMNPARMVWLEAAGVVYLTVLYFLLLGYFAEIPDRRRFFARHFGMAAMLAAVPAIIGWLLAMAGFPNRLVWFYPDYPYFGDIYRARGFMQSPSLLISLVAMAILWNLPDFRFNRRKLVGATVLFLALILSFAKTNLLLAASILLWAGISYFPKRIWRQSARLGAFVFASLLLAGTYFIWVPPDACQLAGAAPSFRAAGPTWTFTNGCLVETANLILVKSAWFLGCQNWPIGIGYGAFMDQVPYLKETGIYPAHIQPFEPHSTLWGTYAELGLPGLVALGVIFYLVIQNILKLECPKMQAIFWSILLFVAVEAIINDINSFRHYWVVLAALSSIARKPSMS